MARVKYPKRGEVFLVSFDPAVGSEIRKTRPAVVIQNDVANEYSPVTIVAAITSKFGHSLRSTEALITGEETGLGTPSVALLNQIRTVDRARLVKRLGAVDDQTVRRIARCLKISFGLIDF